MLDLLVVCVIWTLQIYRTLMDCPEERQQKVWPLGLAVFEIGEFHCFSSDDQIIFFFITWWILCYLLIFTPFSTETLILCDWFNLSVTAHHNFRNLFWLFSLDVTSMLRKCHSTCPCPWENDDLRCVPWKYKFN